MSTSAPAAAIAGRVAEAVDPTTADQAVVDRDSVLDAARRARIAAAELAVAPSSIKDAALRAMAEAIRGGRADILAANAR